MYVCRKCKRGDCLNEFLEHAQVKTKAVGCQKLCGGAVVGLEVDGRMEWFEKVDRAKAMVGLVRVATGRKRRIPKALEKRREPKRSGRSPR